MLLNHLLGKLNGQAVRSRLLLIASVVIVAVVSPQFLAAFQEASDAKLEAAKEAHKAGIAEAKAKVSAVYQAEIAKLTAKKNIDGANRLQDEQTTFEKAGWLFARPELRKSIFAYGETQKKLGDKLSDAYLEAAVAQTQAGKPELADGLRRELATLALPYKLNSIKLFGTSGYVSHGDYKGLVRPAPNLETQLNSTFEIVTGLSESAYVSFRSLSCPNHYLNHSGFKVRLSGFEDNPAYRVHATFKKVNGLGKSTGVSFESANFPGHYIRAWNGELFLERVPNSKSSKDSAFQAHTTFAIVEPLAKLW